MIWLCLPYRLRKESRHVHRTFYKVKVLNSLLPLHDATTESNQKKSGHPNSLTLDGYNRCIHQLRAHMPLGPVVAQDIRYTRWLLLPIPAHFHPGLTHRSCILFKFLIISVSAFKHLSSITVQRKVPGSNTEKISRFNPAFRYLLQVCAQGVLMRLRRPSLVSLSRHRKNWSMSFIAN